LFTVVRCFGFRQQKVRYGDSAIDSNVNVTTIAILINISVFQPVFCLYGEQQTAAVGSTPSKATTDS